MGVVRWYRAEKGYGFIAPDDGGGDVFVHVKGLSRGLTELTAGQRVSFRTTEAEKGLRASDVILVVG
jgi:CspA family cold shock protein